MIWAAAATALILGIGLGVLVRNWALLLIPLVPYAGILVVAVTGAGPGGGEDWSRVLPVAFLNGTAPMALGIVAGIRLAAKPHH